MSRQSLKRKIDVCYSPDSSTPPRPPTKKAHISSVPSDSPTNPFGLKGNGSYKLPYPSRVSDHLLLRFQLNATGRNIHRVVTVPGDYTFWHLHKLTQFLFGWKVPGSASLRKDGKGKSRVTEHRFDIMKDVKMSASSGAGMGFIKSGRTWAVLLGCSPANGKILQKAEDNKYVWYQEESYRIENIWSKGPDATKAITYVTELRGYDPPLVFITIVKSRVKGREEGNSPRVLEGRGLPNDDEDDEDFALDLLQWNETGAFEDYLEDDEDYNQYNGMSLSSPDFTFRIEKSLSRINKMSEKDLLEFKQEQSKAGPSSSKNAVSTVEVVECSEEEVEDSEVDELDEEDIFFK